MEIHKTIVISFYANGSTKSLILILKRNQKIIFYFEELLFSKSYA
jgi:hypothetical protein